MYKVFYNNNYLIISDKNTKCNACKLINCIDNTFILDFSNDNINENYLIITKDIDSIITELRKYLKYRKAAGGMVIRNNKVLLIKHYNVWDLPKGGIEENESEENAALREVTEECGITNQKIEKKLIDTFHIFKYNGTLNLKHSVWFLMNYSGNEDLKPQFEENISEVVWVSFSELPNYFDNMYNSVRELLAMH